MLVNIDLGVLILRGVIGLVFAGHGGQKLFGWFGGRGLAGHSAVMEKLGIRPAGLFAAISSLGEFFGGLGLALGLFTSLAAAVLVGSMLVAVVKVHWSNGFWNGNRGIEFPFTLGITAFVLGLIGPGIYSLDYILGVELPEPLTYLVALVATLIAVAFALASSAVTAREQEHRTA
jgi:putative oxidoreductase